MRAPNKIDILTDVIYKIYVLLRQHYGVPDPKNKYVEYQLLSRQEVKDYLGISEATYKRKVKDGTLKPIKLPGGDRFFQADLRDEVIESVRRGRI